MIVMPRSFSSSMWSMVAPSPPPRTSFNLVDAAGVEQNPLAQGRLARVDVSGDADVAKFLEVHG